MSQMKPTRTVYTVSNFVEWQRTGVLDLKPRFQRREVWKPKAKSLFIDTVVKGLPIPIVFLRQRQNLETLSMTLEVVDGQQRLRTLFSYIKPSLLPDFDGARDDFTVIRTHNKELAGKTFSRLDRDTKNDILGYEISTHVFPANTSDDAVLRIFARLNSTGSRLNAQEVRNSQFYGDFKTLAYELGYRHLELWRRFGLFSDDDLARMNEVETVSDILIMIMKGAIQGKNKGNIDRAYKDYDDDLPSGSALERRFDKTIEYIDQSIGGTIASTRFSRPVLFYSLFSAVYEHMYGESSDYRLSKTPRALPVDLSSKVVALNDSIVNKKLPENVQDAIDKATVDLGRRKTRHRYFLRELGLG